MDILFSTAAGGTTTNTERMRIDSSGNLWVNYIPNNLMGGKTNIGFNGSTHDGIDILDTVNASAAWFMAFRNSAGTTVGKIQRNGGDVSYSGSSDQRLKENIADAEDAGSKIDSIQVRQFDWIAEGEHRDYGFIAQELIEVFPEAVGSVRNAEEMMGVDNSKLVPMLVKEIQSLRKRVAQLEE